jgi:RNA polymerase sporulation-specific sigma factor
MVKCFENMNDEEVLELSRNGDGNATEFILEKYRNFVRGKSRTYFLIGADREDIIQEGMIGLYKAIRDYRPDCGSTFRSFADLCVTRQIITAIKTATRQKHMPLNSYISLNRPVYDDDNENALLESVVEKHRFDPEEILINKERFIILEKNLISSLSKYESTVLKLYLCGHSYTDIAHELQKTEKSIDNALQRIRKKILLEVSQNK